MAAPSPVPSPRTRRDPPRRRTTSLATIVGVMFAASAASLFFSHGHLRRHLDGEAVQYVRHGAAAAGGGAADSVL
eukprot:CAMPEP_0194318242 /NCGR_PEP_ID=MMETSP0171-20130528/14872_1 /TAXON_ID=218684 /ORGANISM="Corethron pennatum, Strain L29A3" /LENGTH=74 /DNA_ID=CAMNT_0039075087 /DNA_START=48 /DNA_END=269 /DNA_ORIENTATION=-